MKRGRELKASKNDWIRQWTHFKKGRVSRYRGEDWRKEWNGKKGEGELINRPHVAVFHTPQASVHKGWREGTQWMSAINQDRREWMEGWVEIIFCPLRDHLARYSVRQHQPSNMRPPQVLGLRWLRQTQWWKPSECTVGGCGTIGGWQNTGSITIHKHWISQFSMLLFLKMSCT